jgi:hypothetical protein
MPPSGTRAVLSGIFGYAEGRREKRLRNQKKRDTMKKNAQIIISHKIGKEDRNGTAKPWRDGPCIPVEAGGYIPKPGGMGGCL